MRRLRHGLPLWLDRPAPRPTFPRHTGTDAADVVIVGGGMTGAICAYLFAEAGVRVFLLESRIAGCGSTAASTALLMQEPDRDFADLRERFGPAAARDIWGALARATRELGSTIRTLGLDVELRECDSVYFTRDPQKVEGLRREFDIRKRAGLPGRWLSPRALYRATGIDAPAGIITRHNAQLNPVSACRGFLDAAAARGAGIFERSLVRSVKASKSGVEVRTTGGIVRAGHVVVATGYATPAFRGLVGRFQMKDTYVIATRRLPDALRRRVLGSATVSKHPLCVPMAWDTERPYHYIRWTGDGRLLVGGEDIRHRNVKGARGRISRARAKLLAYLGEIYPELSEERPEYAWEGLFAETPDGLPYVGTHSRYPRHLFALGYGGNGMTASFLAARLLRDLYQYGDKRRPKVDSLANLFAFRRGRR